MKECNARLTSGLLNRDINTKSMIARVNNLNNFDVSVELKVTINDGITQTLQLYYCQTLIVPACSTGLFDVIDATDFNTLRLYTVWFEINTTDATPRPVCDKVHVYFAERSDLPNVLSGKNHLCKNKEKRCMVYGVIYH